MKLAVKDLLPNPYRHTERYPVIEAKVDTLLASIEQTSFWDNLLARKAPNKAGKYELAYGVHRLAALKRAHISEIDIPVRPLDDATMIKIMANENMEEWGHSAAVGQETIRAVVEGYAKGDFELPASINGQVNGPHFDASSKQPFKAHYSDHSSGNGRVYTIEALAEFLGWKKYKVDTALAALKLIGDNLVDEETLAGLTAKQAKVVTAEIAHALKETDNSKVARAVGRKIAAGMKRSVAGHDSAGYERNVQDVTIHNARTKTEEMIKPHRTQEAKAKPKPPAGKFIPALAQQMSMLPTDKLKTKVEAVVAARADVNAKDVRMLTSALRGVAKRFERMAEQLEA